MANLRHSNRIVLADSLTDEEITIFLAEELKAAPAVNYHLTALQAYQLVAVLQLASRYPGFANEHPSAMAMIREFADQLKYIGPVTAMTLQWGFERGFDRKRKPDPSTGAL